MRRVKHALLALVGVLMLTALLGVGSATAASQFQVKNDATGQQEYPSTVSGATATVKFTLGSWANFECASPFEANMERQSQSMTLSTLTCEPNFHLKSFAANGCQFTFRPGAESAANEFSGSFDIGGSKCTGIKVETASPTCKVTIPAQSVAKGVTLKNLSGSPGTMSLDVNANIVSENETGTCGTIGTQGGTMSASWTLKAFHSGVQRTLHAVWLPTGIKHEATSFTGESYPLEIYGSQSTKLTLKGTEGLAQYGCASASFADALGSATGNLPLVTSLSGCLSEPLGHAVTVTFNRCQYVLEAGNTLGVACTGNGEYIEYSSTGLLSKPCIVKVPAQTGVAGVAYTNIGSGDNAGIQATLAVTGLETIDIAGQYCGAESGTYHNGSLKGSIELFGRLAS